MSTKTVTPRIASVDILRGLVMIIMALDHTRDFFHESAQTANPLDPATTTPLLFFTRWITHFCAPVFVFLSGLSVYLSSRNKPVAEASAFLIKRGCWLIIVELCIMTLGITFNPFYNFIILQVIWAIGWSMLLLGLFMRISFTFCLVAGLIFFLGHNALDYANLPQGGVGGNLMAVLLTTSGRVIPLDSTHFVGAFYAILPWTGVMLLGYCIGKWFAPEFPAATRKRYLLITGVSLLVTYIVLRLLKGYGDPGAWDGGFYSFLNTSKYPPSLQYCGMTLGPALIFLSLGENLRAAWTRLVTVYGKVPFFYYVLHFYILHTLTVIFFFATGHDASQIADPNSPLLFRPTLFGYPLLIVYIIWLSVVGLLYRPCKWFEAYKRTHTQWWLRYV